MKRDRDYRRIAYSLAVLLCGVNLSTIDDSKIQYELAEVNIDANATKNNLILTTSTDKFQIVKSTSKTIIESLLSNNGDFVQLLKANPNVQFVIQIANQRQWAR
ncbi:hypothetical protein KDD93_00885 [Campylobacter sp. faydin G-24]|uniref:Uncharacterized protein n=1 Tax=Campylobacter anatolicus TaxID=2829105 RepID=A0ABS5HFS6_9BACT|nr:hypothetical protein [Campylobacter anatolicus]MBR8463129.1 hypothetical protein [Campylobacter anatolicus]MBR8465551.1 hypothetical protein [Campylobacter anatolicus]